MNSSPNSVFGTQLIGQTEKALNAILGRQLAGTGLGEPHWVALTLTVLSNGPIARDELIGRVAGTLRCADQRASVFAADLTTMGLLQATATGQVETSEAGRAQWHAIRDGINRIIERLWGDLPADELAMAGRVLSTVLERANAELAAA